MADSLLSIELVYASETQHTLLALSIPKGATIREAIRFSGLLSLYPEIELENVACGVFSQRKSLEDIVSDGDRIEIYRPLIVDPKEARRARARQLQAPST